MQFDYPERLDDGDEESAVVTLQVVC